MELGVEQYASTVVRVPSSQHVQILESFLSKKVVGVSDQGHEKGESRGETYFVKVINNYALVQ